MIVSRQSDDSSPLTKWIRVFYDWFVWMTRMTGQLVPYMRWLGERFYKALWKCRHLLSQENPRQETTRYKSNRSWALAHVIWYNGTSGSWVSKRGQFSHSADTFCWLKMEEWMALWRYLGDCSPCHCQHSINMIIAVLSEQTWTAIVTPRQSEGLGYWVHRFISRTLEIAVAYWKHKFTSASYYPLPVFLWWSHVEQIEVEQLTLPIDRTLCLFLGLGESIITNSYGWKNYYRKGTSLSSFLPNESGFVHWPPITPTHKIQPERHVKNTESTEGNLSILRCGTGFVLWQVTATWSKFFALW